MTPLFIGKNNLLLEAKQTTTKSRLEDIHRNSRYIFQYPKSLNNSIASMCVLAPPFEALDAHWKYSQSLQPLPAFRGGLFATSPRDDFPERSPGRKTGRLEINANGF